MRQATEVDDDRIFYRRVGWMGGSLAARLPDFAPSLMMTELGGAVMDATARADEIASRVRAWYEANRETWWDRNRPSADRSGLHADEFMLGLIAAVQQSTAHVDAKLIDTRGCTCHPTDSPPEPCPRKFALTECRAAAARTTHLGQ